MYSLSNDPGAPSGRPSLRRIVAFQWFFTAFSVLVQCVAWRSQLVSDPGYCRLQQSSSTHESLAVYMSVLLPPRDHLCDVRPLVTNALVCLNQRHLLIWLPCVALDVGAQLRCG